MKTRTADLISAALDWAVAKCRGFDGLDEDLWLMRDGIADMPLHAYTPSTDWAQGGPIIEREELQVYVANAVDGKWCAKPSDSEYWDFDGAAYGPTPLIAAMRCLIASKLGDEVDVPKELVCTS